MKRLKFLKRRYIVYSVVVLLISILALGANINVNVDNPFEPQNGKIGNFITVTIGTDQAYAAGTPDYTCDGLDDDVQFQAAMNAIPATGGELEVLGGTYVFANLTSVTRAIDNVTITGVGRGTYFTGDAVTPEFICGGNNWKFQDIRTDAGGITVGATTGWQMINVDLNGTLYSYRDAYTSIVDGTLTTTAITTGGKLTAGGNEIEGSNFDINGGDISTSTISGGLTWSAAQDLNSQNLTNVNIDSGTINDTDIIVDAGDTLNTTGGTLTSGPTQDVGESKDDGVWHLYTATSFISPSATAGTNWILVDGTADESDFNTAITAIASAGGGKIVAHQGVFVCDAPIKLPNTIPITIEGMGMGSTIIQWDSSDAGFTGYYSTLITNQTGTGPETWVSTQDVVIKDLSIIDTRGTPAQSWAIALDWNDTATSDNWRIENVEAEECGIYPKYVTTGRTIIRGCYVHDITTGDRAIGSSFNNYTEITGFVINNVDEMGIGASSNAPAADAYIDIHDGSVIDAGQSTSGYSIDTNEHINVHVHHVYIHGNSGVLSENSPGPITFDHITVDGGDTTAHTGIQVWRDGAGEAKTEGIVIDRNTVINVRYGIQIYDIEDAEVTGNIVHDIGDWPVKTAQSYGEPRKIIIKQNDLYNWALNTASQSGIHMGTDYTDVLNNIIDGGTGGTSPNGIVGNNDKQVYSRIIGNTIKNGGSTPLDNIGIGCEIKDNIGYIAAGEVRTFSGTLQANKQDNDTFIWENHWNADLLVTAMVKVTAAAGAAAGLNVADVPAASAENCEDDWADLDAGDGDGDAVNFAVSLDTDNEKVGAGCVKFVVLDGGAAGVLMQTEDYSANISGYGGIAFWAYSTVATDAGDFQILLDDTADCPSPVETLDVPALQPDEWARCWVPFETASANRAAILSIGAKYTVDIGAVTFYLDDVRIVDDADDLIDGVSLNVTNTVYDSYQVAGGDGVSGVPVIVDEQTGTNSFVSGKVTAADADSLTGVYILEVTALEGGVQTIWN